MKFDLGSFSVRSCTFLFLICLLMVSDKKNTIAIKWERQYAKPISIGKNVHLALEFSKGQDQDNAPLDCDYLFKYDR